MALHEAVSREKLVKSCTRKAGQSTSPNTSSQTTEGARSPTIIESVNSPVTTASDGIGSFKVGFLPWISVLQRVLELGAQDDSCTPQQWIVKALGSARVDLTHAPLLNHLIPELELDSIRLFKLAFDRGLGRRTAIASTTKSATASNRAVPKCTDLTYAQKEQRLKELITKLILFFASTRPTMIILHLQTGQSAHVLRVHM